MTAALVVAHAFGGRTDLPLPAWLVMYGGAAVLIASFAGLTVLWRQPRWAERPPGRPLTGALTPRRVAFVIARLLGLTSLVVVFAAAVLGSDDAGSNLAPTAVYITAWVGLAFLSFLIGDLWWWINPFDTLTWIAQRAIGRSEPHAATERERSLGYLPAAATLAAFVWCELVFPDGARPRTLAVLIAAYTISAVGVAVAHGRRALDRWEAFSTLFGLLSRGGPVGRDGISGTTTLRPPLSGLTRLRPERGLDTVVLVVLGSTTFDGLTRTQFWTDLTNQFSGNARTAVATVGLAWCIALVALIYHAAMHATPGGNSPDGRAALALAFAPTLVPIALAYAVAHYFSLALFEGQAIFRLASDPFGRGWDLLGTADWRVNYLLVSPTAVAWVQAGAIVVGHIAGVVLAHEHALSRFPDRERLNAQLPLLAAMVMFTIGGLFLLFGT